MIKVEHLELNNRAHLCLFCLDMSVLETLMEQTTGGHVVPLRYIILIPSKPSSPSLLNDAP